MKTMGNLDWVAGYKDGHQGNEFNESMKGNSQYEDGYSRGYETAEIESHNQEYFERQA